MVVNFRVGLAPVFSLLLFSAPFFLQFTLPMSVLVTTLVTFLRLSGDNEILALKAGGVNIWRLVPPVMGFAAVVSLITLAVTCVGLPWGKISFRHLTVELATQTAEIGLKERVFIDQFDGVVLYAQAIDASNRALKHVFIEDRRQPDAAMSFIAPRGVLARHPDSLKYTLRLYDCVINQAGGPEQGVQSGFSDVYDINLDLTPLSGNVDNRPKNAEEMYFFDLYQAIKSYPERDKNYYRMMMKLHEKFSLPMACFSLAFLAIPLGLQSIHGRKSTGIGLGLGFFILYYILLAAGWSLGESGKYPPAVGMWMPDVVTGGMGIWMLARIAKEKPVLPIIGLFRLPRLLKKTGDAA